MGGCYTGFSTGEIPIEELLAQYGVQLGSAGSTPASTEGIFVMVCMLC